MPEQEKLKFTKKCRDIYADQDFNRLRFDPFDMSGRLEGPDICETLYNLRNALRDHRKAELTDVVRYSYLLSIQTFIETEQAKDYGRCEEVDARQSQTFCTEYFEWTDVFSQWTRAKDIDPMCA